MKTFKKTLACIIALLFCTIISACSNSKEINLEVYFKTDVVYKVNNAKDSGSMHIGYLTTDKPTMDCYTVIQLTSNKDWTYGLNLEKVEFVVFLSEEANVDIDITISNLENGENYNKTEDTYFYHTTISLNKTETKVKLDINDTIINKECVISFEIVQSCYKTNPNLTLSINSLKLIGEHKELNY